MDEERTDIVVEIKSKKHGVRRLHITVSESLDPRKCNDAKYLQKMVHDLDYLIIDELRQIICAETGEHPDSDVDVPHDFSIEDWWLD